MTEEQRRDPEHVHIEHVLELCRLEVPDVRKAQLAEAMAGFQEDFRLVEAIDLREVILGSVFDPRWS